MNNPIADIVPLILNTVPEGIAWKDRDFVYQGCNAQFARAAGLEAVEQIIGKTDQDLPWHQYSGDYLHSDRQVLESNQAINKMVEYYHNEDADDIWLEVSLFPLNDVHNSVVGILIIFRDFTEDMHIKQELHAATTHLESLVQQRTQDLSNARDDAIEANKAKSLFLSNMSHELRTPLNAILGFGQLLQMEHAEKHGSESEDISEILHAGNHLLKLINDILDLSKVEAGALSLNPIEVRVDEIIDECFKLTVSMAVQNRVSLRSAHINEGVMSEGLCQHTILVDRLRFKQVMLNLISNAIKYNVENGFVSVYCQTLENDFIRVTVEDTGKGIAPEKQARLFTAFERLGAEDQAIEGTGIGLVLSKKLIEEMGGQIGFKSQKESGSLFWVDLPLVEVQSHQDNVDLNQEQMQVNYDEKTVVYIEDNPSNQFVMKKIFKTCFKQWHLLIETDAVKGLQQVLNVLPDLILLDINMPGLDGYQVYEQLQAAESTRPLPVIAVTALAMADDLEKARSIGFDACITKPIDIDVFISTINRVLK